MTTSLRNCADMTTSHMVIAEAGAAYQMIRAVSRMGRVSTRTSQLIAMCLAGCPAGCWALAIVRMSRCADGKPWAQ